MSLFKRNRGIIPACDVEGAEPLKELVRETADLDFIQGYKIGALNLFTAGLRKSVESIRTYSKHPIIYDHQKYGTDIPSICGGRSLRHLKEAGVDGLIIFPQAGLETLKATVQGCLDLKIIPIVGGEMTHKGYLVSEGGYIDDNAPERIYLDAARCGTEYFIVPGTRIDKMRRYKSLLEAEVKSPKFIFPGVGCGQGGDLAESFKAVEPHNGYAIVGRGIYESQDKKASAIKLWREVMG